MNSNRVSEIIQKYRNDLPVNSHAMISDMRKRGFTDEECSYVLHKLDSDNVNHSDKKLKRLREKEAAAVKSITPKKQPAFLIVLSSIVTVLSILRLIFSAFR